MKDKKTPQEQTAELYQQLMSELVGQDVVERLLSGLEESTGLSATQPQREYIRSMLDENAMKWASVMQNVNQAIQDPEIAAKYKQKVDQGK